MTPAATLQGGQSFVIGAMDRDAKGSSDYPDRRENDSILMWLHSMGGHAALVPGSFYAITDQIRDVLAKDMGSFLDSRVDTGLGRACG